MFFSLISGSISMIRDAVTREMIGGEVAPVVEHSAFKPKKGWRTVGKIQYATKIELGSGSGGTIVFKGTYAEREVAVKRVLLQNVQLATREVDALLESDSDDNVIRYFYSNCALDHFRITWKTGNSLSSGSGTVGSMGWMSPEALKLQSTSFPTDIFSLGLVFYYVLTGGSHPYGEHYQLSSNIASDRFVGEDFKSLLSKRIMKNGKNIVKTNWTNELCDELKNYIRTENNKFYTGRYEIREWSLRDLIRLIRNLKHHYWFSPSMVLDLPDSVRSSIGENINKLDEYFTGRFPHLLLHVYEAMEWCSDEPAFQHYYSDEIKTRMESERRQAMYTTGESYTKKVRPDSGMPTAPQIPKKSQHAKAPVHPKYRTSEIMSTPRKDSGSIEKENLP
ncbi:hypothetical protein PRIPAC_87977 [Pristionchus pacificus]|uniref:non-specific serine/threonine protein kinase n=1 Tax=Pristionchus pacificus TaxID=54126 RepID=A0A2A6B768_PRIPA|nr:hypothetical protein PRIPAC_87977 [Pristionchus pacificus]|eukprot:PDM61717.1 protein kinase [Pristionchus pacificus]